MEKAKPFFSLFVMVCHGWKMFKPTLISLLTSCIIGVVLNKVAHEYTLYNCSNINRIGLYTYQLFSFCLCTVTILISSCLHYLHTWFSNKIFFLVKIQCIQYLLVIVKTYAYVTIEKNRSSDQRTAIRGSNPAKILQWSADRAPIWHSSGDAPANLTGS